MTVTFATAGENIFNTSSLSGTPAVEIAGNAIVFTNTERGRLASTSASVAALTITGQGVDVINQAGGLISANDFLAPAITGSRFADSIDNSGTISGVVRLGAGNDHYIHRTNDFALRLELAEDDDKLEIVGSNFEQFSSLDADGGTGEDTLVLGGSIGRLSGAGIRNFEHLVLGPYAENLEALSGFRSITVLGRPQGVTYTSVGLLNADNPGVDIVFAGSNNFRIGGNSRFADIIATPGADSVEIFAYSGGSPVSSGAVLLGDGDDTFRIIQSAGGTISIANGVNGGAGFDWFEFSITGSETFDASSIVGFESFNAGSWTSATTNARITGLNGYLEGTLDTDGGMLTIAASASPLGSIRPQTKTAVVFESTTVFGYFGLISGAADYRLTVEQVNPFDGVTFTNRGRIINDVLLSTGDDIYDGRLGSVGGRIYGFAGNDVLRAGTGGSWIEGGFGADDLYGNTGNDTLLGGAGGDILIGGSGADTLTGGSGNDTFSGTAAELSGDTIADFDIGDRITFTGAAAAGSPAFTYSLSGNTLTFTGGSLTLQNLRPGSTVRVAAGAAPGDVDLVLQRAGVRNDFNGDGRSDVLWRNSSGQLSQWLGSSNGALINNGDLVNQSVPNEWRIQGTADFNGDGRADILWRNVNGKLSSWLGQTNGGFTDNGSVVNQSVPTEWKIAATDDFNGDGRADILWRNDNGRLSQWLGTANGGFVDNGGIVNQSVPTEWKIVRTGDFNGDGRSDVLWRNDNGQLSQWLGSATGRLIDNGGNVNQVVPNEWKIAGTGDFNGDGFTDVLWRNANGRLSEWLGSASGRLIDNGGIVNQVVPNEWKIVGTGDFNGDGRADIAWRNDNGQLSEWLGTPNGGFIDNGGIVNQLVPNAWTIYIHDYQAI